MHNFLKMQSVIVPEMIELLQKRYIILRSISLAGPIGRRTLSERLGITERVLRSEAEFLKSRQLIDINTAGMFVTEKGMMLLEEMEEMMRDVYGIRRLEEMAKDFLSIASVKIVPGDSDEAPLVKEELGKACADQLRLFLNAQSTIAVTGGTTMAYTADMLTADMGENRDLMFVPARGGIGEDVKSQANVICATMAEKTGGSYRVLYVPDQVGREAYDLLLKEPAVMEILTVIKTADIVIHGIGDALTMAKRRRTPEVVLKEILQKNAVGEAFGYYFDENGEIVHKVPTIGIQMSDLHNGRHVIAAAGGKSKAKAIKSYMKSAPRNTVLITDEGAVRELLKGTSYKDDTF